MSYFFQVKNHHCHQACSKLGLAEVDLCHVKAASKPSSDMVHEHVMARCQDTFIPSSEDFGHQWNLLVEFINFGFLRSTKVIDFRLLPEEACSDFLWAVLCTLENLERVVVTHAGWIPCLSVRHFQVEVSLQA